ncbi:MAG: hypothetical protein U1A77_00110 [Pirellulales bacterium]
MDNNVARYGVLSVPLAKRAGYVAAEFNLRDGSVGFQVAATHTQGVLLQSAVAYKAYDV